MLLLKARGLAAALVLFASLFVDAAFNDALALKPRGPWSPSVNYALDDIVTLRGSTWRSKHANNKGKLPGSTTPSTAADWELFASGFNPIGGWVSSRTYQRNDLVTRSGAVYLALRTSLNKTPGLSTTTADWQVFVLRGATGPQGPQGVPGSTAVGNGSATAPAFRFTSSPNTGIFSPSAGKIAMVAGGSLFLHDIGSDNLGLGLYALSSNTTGQKNLAIGKVALLSNTEGSNNVAVGLTALLNNSTGNSNTAVGNLAMQVNVTGSQNTALGDHALFQNDAGDNTAVGFQALQDNTSGSNNTAVGSLALTNNTTGGGNTAIGLNALGANNTGFLNLAVGDGALASNTSGSFNTAFGISALGVSQTASFNTALGLEALQNLASGSHNTALGRQALRSTTTGDFNTALGNEALFAMTTGDDNIAVGNTAGKDATNPSNSIFIGNRGAGADTDTIKIGNSQTTAFIAGIRGKTTGMADAVAVLIDSNGQLGTVSSSRRYKEDIQPMGAMSDMLARLRPVTFRYIKPYADGSKPIQYGLIAEEVAEVFPYLAVYDDQRRPETVKYHLLPTFLLEGFQEQQKVIAEHAERIAELEARLATIEAMLEQTAVIKASDIR